MHLTTRAAAGDRGDAVARVRQRTAVVYRIMLAHSERPGVGRESETVAGVALWRRRERFGLLVSGNHVEERRQGSAGRSARDLSRRRKLGTKLRSDWLRRQLRGHGGHMGGAASRVYKALGRSNWCSPLLSHLPVPRPILALPSLCVLMPYPLAT